MQALKLFSTFLVLIGTMLWPCSSEQVSTTVKPHLPTTTRRIQQYPDAQLHYPNIIELTNHHRDDKPTLKLSITGANMGTPNKTTHLYVQMDGNRLHLPQPKGTKEVCFYWGHNNASWFSTYMEWDRPQLQLDPHRTSLLNTPTPYITGSGNSHFGPFLEDMLFNSDGFAVTFAEHTPVYFRSTVDAKTGEPLLCFAVKSREPAKPLQTTKEEILFSLYMAENLKEARDQAAHTLISQSSYGIPDARGFSQPGWVLNCTTIKSQTEVLEFAKHILEHKLAKHSQLILTNWEAHPGDLNFDATRFSDPKKLITELHQLGFLVKLRILPFVSNSSPSFTAHNHMLILLLNEVPLMVDKHFGIWNVESQQVRQFLTMQLAQLRTEIGVDSYQFFGGQLDQFEQVDQYDVNEKSVNREGERINGFTKDYVEIAATLGTLVEVDSGYQTQRHSIFSRMLDLEPNWEGLRTLISNALTMSLAGYNFLIAASLVPASNGTQPSEELYIRWVQAAIFMLSMQFTIPPWTYSTNPNVTDITRKFLKLHEEYLSTIIEVGQQSLQSANKEPLLRPIWYLDPADAKTLKIEDQFAVGSNIVVAPVLVEGQRERTVYLPKGEWADHTGKQYQGPCEVKIAVPLEELAYFVRNL